MGLRRWVAKESVLDAVTQADHRHDMAEAPNSVTKAQAAPRVGRPRRLTTEQVVDAGLAVGLDGLTMAAVAQHLGVRVTVLYNYVASRDELMRLASARVAQGHAFPCDDGQHWSVYAAEYARALFLLLVGPGQFIARYLAADFGPELEIDRSEAWLEAFARHGFDASEALALQRQVGEIVIGGALTTLHMRALQNRGITYGEAAKRSMATRPTSSIPMLLEQQALFARRSPVWQLTLRELLGLLAQRRTEPIDIQAIDAILCDTTVPGDASGPD